jgi:hypothetical protein
MTSAIVESVLFVYNPRVMQKVAIISIAALAMGCGAVAGASPGRADPNPEPSPSTSGGEPEAAASEVNRLLVDVIAPRLCSSLRGSFVGLPGEGGATGPQSGTDPTVGRWWIRECTSSVTEDQLSLSIAGTGWTWVDRESMGFRVRQYLRFDASASFNATMEIGYDRARRIATIWMRPGEGVIASVEARGLVEAQATNAMATMLGGLLEMTGSSANQRAEQEVGQEGSRRLREQFATGFTVTFAMDSEQMDFMVGALPRGDIPLRPYEPEAGVVWSVNQRVRIWPGGMDVLGPVPEGRGPQALDLELEEGEGLIVDAVCASDFESYYDRSLRGEAVSAPRRTRIMDFTQAGRAQRASIPALGCATLLVLMPNDHASIPTRMRLRVTPADAPTATRSEAQAIAAETTSDARAAATPTPGARAVRIQMTSLVVAPLSSSESRWDMIGGEPDPYVVVISIPGQREIHRTIAAADQRELPLDEWLAGAFRPEDLPLRFRVYDDDVGTDEVIGIGDLTAAQITSASGEVRIDLRSEDVVPRTMGTLWLRVQPIQ